MTTIVAVHPKISPLVQDCLIKTEHTPVSIQSSLSPSSNVNKIFTMLSEKSVSLVVLDISLLSKVNCLDTLRRLRLGYPNLRIILLSSQQQFLEQHRNELAILQIFDLLTYRTNASGLVELQDSLPRILLHPVDAMEYLQQKVFEQSKDTHTPASKSYLAVAGLEERSGTTKAALLLSQYLRGSVLLVELNQKHPVFREYFILDEYLDAANGLYYLPEKPNLAILPSEMSDGWIRHLDNFQHIVLDLGVLSRHTSDSNYVEFLRSSRSILTSLSSPWSIQKLRQLDLPRKDVSLWLNFCPHETLKMIQRSLEEKFSTIVSAPYQPNWLTVSKEQNSLCKLFISDN